LLTYDDLFQRSPNAYMVLDREFRYLEANGAYESLTGLGRDALLGRCLFDLFPGTENEDGTSQAEVLRASLQRAFDTGERDMLALIPYAIATETADGPVVAVRYWSATHTPLRDAQGRVYAVLQHTTDVTELERLREEVRLSRAMAGPTTAQLQEGVMARAAAVQQRVQALSAEHRFLTDLFEQAPGFVAVMRGPRHVYTLVNDAYERLAARSGFVGLEVREALPDLATQGFFELLDNVYATGEPYLGTGVPVVFGGAGEAVTRFVDFVYQPIRDASGAVEGIFVQGADVTDRHVALDALRAADRQKDQFLATLAHELRNPLSPISVAAELLRRSPDPATVARAAEIIARQAEHMRHLVEDLVDVSRVTRGLVTIDPHPVPLATIVAAAVEQTLPAVDQRGHRLEVDDAAPGLMVDADAVRLTQVVANLLGNAAKYTPPGGEIRVSIAREGGEAVLRVRDNGIGMDATLLPRVFELFAQAEVTPARRVGGLGIGLALALSMARMHGGSLHAESAGLGKGSLFELRLPMSREGPPAPAAAVEGVAAIA
jgi:PAS domain S-box-containing protein